MKRLFFILIFTLFHNVCFSQLEQNQSVKQIVNLLALNSNAIDKYLISGGYQFSNKSGNFYTYVKSTPVSAYNFTVSYRNGKVSGLTWDEFIQHFGTISNELSSLGFKMTTSAVYGSRDIRGFENIHRNLMATLTTKGNYFSVVLGAKNPTKPVLSFKSEVNDPVKAKWVVVPDSYCSPKSELSKILSKPDPRAMHRGWKERKLPKGCFFYVEERITNSQGVFYSGELTYSDGTGDGQGPYFILASEWDSKDIHYEK